MKFILEVFYVRICRVFSWTNAIPVFFKVCNLKPVFEKAEFDVAGKVLFRRIKTQLVEVKTPFFTAVHSPIFHLSCFMAKVIKFSTTQV